VISTGPAIFSFLEDVVVVTVVLEVVVGTAEVALAFVAETWTFKIGAPRLIAFEVSKFARLFCTLSIPPVDDRVFY